MPEHTGRPLVFPLTNKDEGVGFEPSRWDDLRVSPVASKAGGSKAPVFTKFTDNGAGSQGVFAYAFGTATEKELYFEVQLPHTWVAGSDIKPHVHWSHVEASPPGTTNVQWGLEYTWANADPPGHVFGTTTIITGSTTVPVSSTRQQFITSLGTIDGTSKWLSSVLLCRVFRDVANDNFAGDAFALSFDFHIQHNTWGSIAEFPSI